jgi:hypothetical protein
VIALKGFGELVMIHKGARICVMGGGPSLASDLEKVDADIWISTNAHGAKLRPVDYVVAMDNQHTKLKVPMLDLIRTHTDAPIIGLWNWCDYGITEYPLNPRMMFTGVVATWAASLMGAHPVILAGFDCTDEAKRSIGQFSDYKKFVQCEVRVVSGPLTKFWPAYDANEKLGEYRPPEVFGVDTAHGVRVQVRKPIEIRGHQYPIGTVLRIPKAEVWRQIKHRSLIELPEETAKPRGRPRKLRLLEAA